jgi:hypothetical protein
VAETDLSEDAQFLLDRMVEHEHSPSAGPLVFVAHFASPEPGEPVGRAALWSEDSASGIKRRDVIGDGTVLESDTFTRLEAAGLVKLDRGRTAAAQGEAGMVRAYIVTAAGRAQSNSTP